VRTFAGRDARRLAWIGLLAAALLVPVVLPLYYLIVLERALALSIACLAVNLLLGYTGLLSLGHAAYFGIGAYAGGFLFTFADVTSLEAYLLAGALAAAALAALVGALCVRATRIFFTMLTLACAQAVRALFVGGAAFRPFGEYGKGFFLIGEGGLYLPRFRIAGRELAPGQFEVAFYYVVLGLVLGAAVVLSRIARSPYGLALRAIRDNETRAALVGVRIRRYRWRAFVISGVFAGLAGALAGQIDRQVTPHQLDWVLSAELVVAAVLGGSRHFWGPLLGALAVVALDEIALRFALYRGFVFGGLLILAVLAFPGGLIAAGTRLAGGIASRVRGRGRRPAGSSGSRPGPDPAAPGPSRPRGGRAARPRP
jgi:branched-chain amino acid transport system permease protein